jgi:hypothetical protein
MDPIFGYVVALLGVALIAYLLKARVAPKEVVIAFATFLAVGWVWGAAADWLGLKPSDLASMILYSLVAFSGFWVVWSKVRSKV